MGVKEASIAAGVLGGAGGVGASYATDNFGFGFGSSSKGTVKKFSFTPSDCTKDDWKANEVDKLNNGIISGNEKVNATDLGDSFDANSGCLYVKSFLKGTEIERISFELALN